MFESKAASPQKLPPLRVCIHLLHGFPGLTAIDGDPKGSQATGKHC